MRVGAGLVELAADRERRVRGAVLQRDREQRGGGGLAVRAGDGDDLAAAHHRLERGGPRQQPQPQPLRLDHLGVVVPDGGGDHEGVDVADLVGRVADVAARPERTQRLEGAGLLGVAAADGDAARQHDPSDAGQPGTADAHEVHPAEPVGGQQLVGDGDPHRRPVPAARSTMRASCSSASRGMRPEAAADIAASRSGSPASAGHGRGHPLRGQRGVLHQQPAAGVDDRAGVELLLAVADRQRHEHRRQPDGGDLGDGVGPGPADHQVGRGVGEVHAVDVRQHDVRRLAGLARHRRLALRTDDVDHLHTRGDERRRRRGERLVQPARALRAAGDQHGRPVGVEPELATGLAAQRRPVEGGDHPPDRQPDVRPRAAAGCPGSWSPRVG